MKHSYRWFVEKILSNNREEILKNTGRCYGAISCPTGWGKTGMIFDNMLYHMSIAFSKNQKCIINLCSPILLLCQQTVSNFLSILTTEVLTHCNIDKSKIVVVINNSSSANSINTNGIDCIKFSNFEKEFINSSLYQIAIVVSCNKSLDKFTNFLANNSFLNTEIITYLDEAHTLSIADEKDIEKGTTQKIDLETLCANSTHLYLISATNKQTLVNIVNKYGTGIENDDTYCYSISPKDAIESNIICGPMVKCWGNNDGKVTPALCKKFLGDVKRQNSNYFHKVLITCSDTIEAKKLAIELAKSGFPVFLSTSETGQIFYNDRVHALKDCPKIYKNVLGFTKEIEEFKGHCFVIHIRQLISGIDVAGLTDAIISKNDLNDRSTYDTLIQIIGRCLRLGSERGIDIKHRKKQYATILFVTNQEKEYAQNCISSFFIGYYGIDNIKFDIGFSSNYKNKTTDDIMSDFDFKYREPINGESTKYIIDVKLKIENWVKELIPKISYLNSNTDFNYKNSELYKKHINSIVEKARTIDNTTVCYSSKFFDTEYEMIRNFVINAYKKYGI